MKLYLYWTLKFILFPVVIVCAVTLALIGATFNSLTDEFDAL